VDINLYEQFCLLVQVDECSAPVSGLPQYNVGSFDPFFIKEVSQKRGGTNMNYQLKLKNVYERGWSKSLVTKFRYDAPARLSIVKVTELHLILNPVRDSPSSWTLRNSAVCPHSVLMCFISCAHQAVIISSGCIDQLVCVIEMCR
jgi:hypothetical protein